MDALANGKMECPPRHMDGLIRKAPDLNDDSPGLGIVARVMLKLVDREIGPSSRFMRSRS